MVIMRHICLFAGSKLGAKAVYAEAAREAGRAIARAGYGMVYGGARVGLMGVAANAALEAGGEVTGVIPEALKTAELAHDGLTRLYTVGSMHERKALMAELSDAFIAIPGGLGTLEEFFEVCTWAQLGFHRKPCGLLNADNYYRNLIQFLDYAAQQEFFGSETRRLVLCEADIALLLEKIEERISPNGQAGLRPLREA
jgi:uncharacterized protein (TIGR00730 family)